MSGILNNKQRVIDAIVTLEGRKQIASGKLKIEYVSFTDACSFYKADALSGSADASRRVYLEACSLPQDQVVFEADDSGQLMPMSSLGDVFVKSGQLMQYATTPVTSSVMSGSNESLITVQGDAFASQITGILTSSLDNLQNLRIIGTNNPLFDDEGFLIGPSSIGFIVTDDQPLTLKQRVANSTHMESLFNDPRLCNLKNFKYMPPINKVKDRSKSRAENFRRKIGNYRPAGGVKWHNDTKDAYETLRNELKWFERRGYCKTISIDPTSRDNNLLCQFFEITHNRVRKLDVIDFGTFTTHQTSTPIAHVFFVGQVVVDENNTNTFVHLFTLIFE